MSRVTGVSPGVQELRQGNWWIALHVPSSDALFVQIPWKRRKASMNHPNSVDLEARVRDVLPRRGARRSGCAECMTFVARASAFVADAPGRDVPQLPAEKAPSSTVVPFPVRRAVFLALPFVAVAASASSSSCAVRTRR
ncbi:MAG: hypothetical protein U0169_27000 [Polyangiaceae bacterium]